MEVRKAKVRRGSAMKCRDRPVVVGGRDLSH
jgi:hypothetical protein